KARVLLPLRPSAQGRDERRDRSCLDEHSARHGQRPVRRAADHRAVSELRSDADQAAHRRRHLRGPVVEQSPRPTSPVRADRHRLASRALRSRRSVGRRLLDPDHDSRYRQFGTAAALRAPRRHGRLPGGALGARNLSEENGMSTITKDESAVREGKTYGYQRAPEAISGGASIAERKNQVVTAFEDFLD